MNDNDNHATPPVSRHAAPLEQGQVDWREATAPTGARLVDPDEASTGAAYP